MRPVLRPGLQILRRDVRTLQLGHDWPGLAAIPDGPAVQAVLDAVDGFRDLDGVLLAATEQPGLDVEACRVALTTLVEAGVVVDRVRAEVPATRQRQTASWWLLAGPDGGGDEIAVERAACRVWVDDPSDDGRLAEAARGLIASAGLGTAGDASSADLVVAASDDLPDRARSDALMSAGVPHVWAHLRDLVGVVGPFVVAGQSPCLRCTDAARAELDPTWTTVVAASAARPRTVMPCDPVLATATAAWAVQEAAVWASNLMPSTFEQVVEVPLGLGQVTSTTYAMHPLCGCGWQTWHDTIGA